jgi:hypothetical protein
VQPGPTPPPAKQGGSAVAYIVAVVLTLLAIAGAIVAVRILRRPGS